MKSESEIKDLDVLRESLREKVLSHLNEIGISRISSDEQQFSRPKKDLIRNIHALQRIHQHEKNKEFLERKREELIGNFASGKEINVQKITPTLKRVKAGTFESDLFRLASLTWSVPVSAGFGRRLRYLIVDEHNGKIMGLIALCDPVFNLAVRDNFIGWNVDDRKARLVNVMSAYVLGAVPPYSMLLGGKLIACLVRSREIYDDFTKTYGKSKGIISNKQKNARLLAVTTTSSLGRSSVYNRLKLDDVSYFESIGYTNGWGHFQIPDNLFLELRDFLRQIGHPSADGNKFGQGPNWKLRATRTALTELHLDPNLMNHGIRREVFISLFAENTKKILNTGKGVSKPAKLLSTKKITDLALDRWMLKRAANRPEYKSYTLEQFKDNFNCTNRTLAEHVNKNDEFQSDNE